MYQVFITGYRLVEVSYTKPYHVYTIEVLQPNSSLRHIVEKRYSEFNTLHRMLKKDTEDTAPFPPKRVRNSQLKVLEQRRSALESYMQKMLRLSSTKQQVLNFLGIENRAQNTNERMNGQVGIGDPKQVRSLTLRHHPILTFQCDPYIQANTTSSLPDIVTNGVLVENSMKVSIAFTQIYLARYADSLLPRKLIAACLTVSGGIMLLFGKTDNYDAMVLLLVVSGLFQGLIWPSLCKVEIHRISCLAEPRGWKYGHCPGSQIFQLQFFLFDWSGAESCSGFQISLCKRDLRICYILANDFLGIPVEY
ncbi:sorting nexin-24-like isoform X5 [Neodiprion virginianus]|uniref:sorting nexin-24-like isoform X5 n=1 Tax=Neodiprion virginianus TaxID=2961670 RepID=UPI001EE71218|nr:sorting nexin-24-like isoform X5 [Neodiprion virginianus]